MSRGSTLSDAFASFGVKATNPRWSWSARSDDGKTVVLALWEDEFEFIKGENKSLIYHGEIFERAESSFQRPGNNERLGHLKWAKKHCDGLFRVIIVYAKDAEAPAKEIRECFARPDLIMKIEKLDEDTGEFQAVSVRTST